MHESKQKQLAIHEQAQEWKDLEQKLNIEPLSFPEKESSVMKLLQITNNL